MEPYHERCAWPLSCRLAFLALAVGAPLIIALSGEPQALWVAIPVAVLLGFVSYRFAWVEIRIGDEGIEYGFRGLRNVVPWDRVRSVEVEAYRFSRYWGWGYRIGGRRDRAYSVIGPDHGLRILWVDEREREWSTFLSSRDPEAAAAVAQRKLS